MACRCSVTQRGAPATMDSWSRCVLALRSFHDALKQACHLFIQLFQSLSVINYGWDQSQALLATKVVSVIHVPCCLNGHLCYLCFQ
jgi:hypothetical protein